MQTFTNAYLANVTSTSMQPVYIAEFVMGKDGKHGVEGVDDFYVGTVDIAEIPDFPYPDRYMPYLRHDTISTITERFDERNGTSSIGTLKFSVLDKDESFSKLLRRAEADTNESVRRQRVELYALFAGATWADRTKVRVLNQSSTARDLKNESITITAMSVLKRMQKKLFIPKATTLGAAVAATGAVSVTLVDAAEFTNPVIHSTFNGGAAVGFIKINDEIMMWTSKAGNVLTVPAAGRAMFGTFEAAHALDDDVSEVAVMKGNPFYIGLTFMTSGNGAVNQYDILPVHWGMALDLTDTPTSEDIDLTTWNNVGANLAGYVAGQRESGIEREFVFSSPIEGKTLLEKHILVSSGAFGRTLGSGLYSIKALDRTPNPPIDQYTNKLRKADVAVLLTDDDIVKMTSLKRLDNELSTSMRINYYPTPRDSKNYTRHAQFHDVVSAKRHGADGKFVDMNVLGMMADATTTQNIFTTFTAGQSRRSSPPTECVCELLPKHHGIEVGDIVGIDSNVPDVMVEWRTWSTWLSDWQIETPAATTFNVNEGDRLLTSDNLIYVCVGAGVTGTAEPTWGANTVTDGTALWYKFDGHLSRAFEVKSVSWNIKTGNPTISAISQPEKPSFYQPSVTAGGVAAYRFAESAYQIGTNINTLSQFTITGDATLGYTATQNAAVTLAGDYFFRGDIVLNNTVTLSANTRLFFASDGTTAIGTLTATSACSINGTGGGLAGGAGGTPDAYVTTTGWKGTIANVTPGTSGGYVGQGGSGGNNIYSGGAMSVGGAGGTATNGANDLIRVLGIGAKPFASLAGIPATLSGSGGGSGGAIHYGTSATGGNGGTGGAGLVLCGRGVDISAALINLSGANGTVGTAGAIAGSASGGGGGGGSIAVLVERDATSTQTILYEPARITISGGLVEGPIGWYAGQQATAGGSGTIIAQVF